MPNNTQSELDAIRTSAAIFPLTSRAFLRMTGSDATRWLNGMVTNNIAALAPGEGNYNFLLNAQGRIQGDCTIYREPSDGRATYLLETDNSQIDVIQTHLDKFIIMDDVELSLGLRMNGTGSNVSKPYGVAVSGQKAMGWLWEEIWDKNEFPFVSDPEPGHFTFGTAGGYPIIILSGSKLNEPEYELWFSDETHLKKTLRWPRFQEARHVSSQAIEAFRILSGVPKFGVDIVEKYLPQETAQTHALHFSKGCYLGQEIVERIHSRGQVHRTFTQFTLTGEMPALPTPLESDGKPAGELTSAALIDGTIYALGYARRELLDTHQPLTYLGGSATPSTTPKLTT